jgi:DNA modification methylase
MPSESVQCCVTSPPYWGLRDYGVDGQIGLEKSPDEFVERLVDVFREVKRVLKDDGTLWVNLGDSYCGGGNNRGARSDFKKSTKQATNRGAIGQVSKYGVHNFRSETIKPKDLVGIPWRVAFALQADGWYLRSDIIWHKPNPMPESVTDRPTKAHEYLFLLSKAEKYFYDVKAIREPYKQETVARSKRAVGQHHKWVDVPGQSAHGITKSLSKCFHPEGRNRRTVWTVTTKGYKGAHFATFPPALIEPCIKAGTRPGDVVLDPFFGGGTTGLVAQNLARDWVGIELNPEYCGLARNRIGLDAHIADTVPA